MLPNLPRVMAENIYDLMTLEDKILHEIKANITVAASIFGWEKTRMQLYTIAYASAPITTGQRMYEVFKSVGVSSQDELKKKDPALFYKEVMELNIRAGEEFAQHIRLLQKSEATKQYTGVICPATFFAKGWTQEHYMSFWERIIETFVDAIHFNNGWQYSNGCVEEYLIGLKTHKRLYQGNTLATLEPKEALERIKQAIEDIQSLGADIKPLYNNYRRIELLTFTSKHEA